MTPSSGQWIVGLALAVGAHVLAFAALGYHEPQALIDDDLGTVISVAGSLDDFATDAEPPARGDESDVEALDDVEEVEAEPVSQIEPEVVETISDPVEPEPADVAADPVDVTPELAEAQAPEPTPEEIEPETVADTPEEIAPETILAVPPEKPVVKTVVEKKPRTEEPKKAPRKVEKRKPATTRKASGNKTATSGTSRGASQNSSGGLSSSAKQAIFAKYKARVRSSIVRRVRSTRGRGTVVVRFTITGGGGVSGSSIIRSSNAALNNAALKAVGSRFPPIPAELPQKITLTVPIAFK